MSEVWGILGDLSKEEIEGLKNMPYGKFKEYVSDIKKKYKGNSRRTFTVRVHEIRSDVTQAFVKVKAYNAEDAVAKAKLIRKNELEWEKSPVQRDKYNYEYTAVQVHS